MDDLIKRSDAIKVAKAFLSKDDDWFQEALASQIRMIPSADRPQGHYIKGENGEWYCSECKRIDDKYSVARFCWHCGARMKGVDDADG